MSSDFFMQQWDVDDVVNAWFVWLSVMRVFVWMWWCFCEGWFTSCSNGMCITLKNVTAWHVLMYVYVCRGTFRIHCHFDILTCQKPPTYRSVSRIGMGFFLTFWRFVLIFFSVAINLKKPEAVDYVALDPTGHHMIASFVSQENYYVNLAAPTKIRRIEKKEVRVWTSVLSSCTRTWIKDDFRWLGKMMTPDRSCVCWFLMTMPSFVD